MKPYSKYTPLNRLLSLTVALFEIGKANLESNTGVLGLLWTTHSQQAPAPPIFPLPPSWNAQMFKYRSVNLKKVLNSGPSHYIPVFCSSEAAEKPFSAFHMEINRLQINPSAFHKLHLQGGLQSSHEFGFLRIY